jgi:hypothetical protein
MGFFDAMGLGQFGRGGQMGPRPGMYSPPPAMQTARPWEGPPITGGGFDRAAYDARYQRGLIPGSPGYQASVQQNPGIDPQTGQPWQATDQGGWGRGPNTGQGLPPFGGVPQPGMPMPGGSDQRVYPGGSPTFDEGHVGPGQPWTGGMPWQQMPGLNPTQQRDLLWRSGRAAMPLAQFSGGLFR